MPCRSQTELDYLGQETPDLTPVVFSPDILSDYENIQSPIFSPAGNSLYITIMSSPRNYTTIFMNKMNGDWTKPYIPAFIKQHNIRYPFVSPDGKKLFFVIVGSQEINGNMVRNSDIYSADIISTGVWGHAQNVGSDVNSEFHERSPSVTRNGTLYFYSDRKCGMGGTDIYRSELKDGRYLEPENLGNQVNSEDNEYNSFISPDESYVLFNRYNHEAAKGSHDIYISFRKHNGLWTEAKNLGATVNTSAVESKPHVSPDGKFLFFSSDRNKKIEIFWIRTQIIEELKMDMLK